MGFSGPYSRRRGKGGQKESDGRSAKPTLPAPMNATLMAMGQVSFRHMPRGCTAQAGTSV
jgi:hypothetical protein